MTQPSVTTDPRSLTTFSAPFDLSIFPLPKDTGERYVCVQNHDILIPSYAGWFEILQIHTIEKRALPEFFNNRNKTKTPSVYKEHRDFMINTYRTNPTEQLTVTACRRNLTGDVCAILRIHAFLEMWGLINYQVDPVAKPSSVSPPFNSQFNIVTTTSKDTKRPTNKTFEQAVPSDKVDLDNGKKPQKCSSCQTISEEEQYGSVTRYNFYLCSCCYTQGKYPKDQKANAFVYYRLKSKENLWTKEQKDLFKEGVNKFGDNWEKVSEHIGTRTYNECILYYLQLPNSSPVNPIKVGDLGLFQYDTEEYKESPIMSVVAFLASTVDPKVAAVAGSIQPVATILDSKEDINKDDNPAEKKQDKIYDLSYSLVRSKLLQYNQRTLQYELLEQSVERERVILEKEKQDLEQERSSLKRKLTYIQTNMAKKLKPSTYLSAQNITPAQLQQQLAVGNINMLMNQVTQGQQQPHALQQQQQQQHQYQMQIQMQIQMQQQQLLHRQQRGRPAGPSMNMSLQ
ncbi:hypothetical protein BY458DRAFT_537287 [Sporodiniella umbellata]|nr:hypothetical protein BY458DRAFT_537287 [Sporodiniella umbellata]